MCPKSFKPPSFLPSLSHLVICWIKLRSGKRGRDPNEARFKFESIRKMLTKTLEDDKIREAKRRKKNPVNFVMFVP